VFVLFVGDRTTRSRHQQQYYGAQHHPAQSNVDIQPGHVLRETATGRGRRRRIVVNVVAADQADVCEEHISGRENIAQVSCRSFSRGVGFASACFLIVIIASIAVSAAIVGGEIVVYACGRRRLGGDEEGPRAHAGTATDLERSDVKLLKKK